MDAHVREQVWLRAGHRCEYCRLRQEHEPTRSFHVEHVVAQQHRGTDDISNLALACRPCNWFKGTNLTSLDPDTNELTRLFNPRLDAWEQHFRLVGSRVVGITGIGRTSVWLLEMNDQQRIRLREMLQELGEWP